MIVDYEIHRLGWKAFQDLCIALVEERLQRPVQTFLPTNDAGRDGAFLGSWDAIDAKESTIQCKFTSESKSNLSLSMLADELPKAQRLAAMGLAQDYIILTNHTVTGASEAIIKTAFQSVGVGRCRVFHRDWILGRIKESSRLRMMVPRLYGLIDISAVLDGRAYQQAQLILSEMGDNLQKLVVTEAHRKSVRAISQYNFVLLLGAPAAGKSTIGASLAVGAGDIWKLGTIKSTSPEHLQAHLDPAGGQFIWIDDAWGSTQYQRGRAEGWNQIFPLMQGAMKRGTRFLITSRDYIWQEARKDLKIQALPVLGKSQVVINVHQLTTEEKARILYNHLKMGDQTEEYRLLVRPVLPSLAKRVDFLPESARRLGTRIFTEQLYVNYVGLHEFFEKPMEFLKQTIENLSDDCRGSIALVFLNGGKVRSPVSSEAISKPATAFGVPAAKIREQLEALNGSLLNLAEDEEGPYWTYRHPTVSDAFSAYVASSPELVEIYLRGARPDSIVSEVVCAGIQIRGAQVVVPDSLHELLADRIASLKNVALARFISFRSNKSFAKRLVALRPDILKRIEFFSAPFKDDLDVDLLVALHRFEMLDEDRRLEFVDEVRIAAVEEADDSFLDHEGIASVLTPAERDEVLDAVKIELLENIGSLVDRLKDDWDDENDPDGHFETLLSAVINLSHALEVRGDVSQLKQIVERNIQSAVWQMMDDYKPRSERSAPTQQSAAAADSLEELFRDVHE